MVFLAIFMMPFYYGSRVRSVPEYLKMRFNEPTRAFNAVSFAIMTVLMSGINLYCMALVFQMLLGWSMTGSIMVAAGSGACLHGSRWIDLVHLQRGLAIFLDCLRAAAHLFARLVALWWMVRLSKAFKNPAFAHLWLNAGTANNPMGVDWIGLASGLGFVLSFGYGVRTFLSFSARLRPRTCLPPSAHR